MSIWLKVGVVLGIWLAVGLVVGVAFGKTVRHYRGRGDTSQLPDDSTLHRQTQDQHQREYRRDKGKQS